MLRVPPLGNTCQHPLEADFPSCVSGAHVQEVWREGTSGTPVSIPKFWRSVSKRPVPISSGPIFMRHVVYPSARDVSISLSIPVSLPFPVPTGFGVEEMGWVRRVSECRVVYVPSCPSISSISVALCIHSAQATGITGRSGSKTILRSIRARSGGASASTS